MTDTTTGPAPTQVRHAPTAAAHASWVIVDGDGLPVGPPWTDRAAALRYMGTLASHGAHLPLVLYAGDGCPTGDRLP
jgi:hypothetical protein